MSVDHLSHSSASLYLDCPACWDLAYLQRRPRKVSPGLCIGNGLHGAMAALRRKQSEDEAVEALRQDFARTLEGIDRFGELPDADPVLDLGKNFASWGAAEDEALRLAPELARLVEAEKDWDVLDVELRVEINTLDLPIVGYADVVLQRGSVALLKDLKSAASNGAPDLDAWHQLALYASALEIQRVGVDQVVKTKTPQVHPWTDEGFSGEVTDALVASVFQRFESVIAGIQRGDFPVGSGGKWGHKFDHPAPVFFSVPAEAVA